MSAARSLIEARAQIYQHLAELGASLSDVDFVLCEDNNTAMIYVDTVDEEDAIAIWFDLGPDEKFEPPRHRHEFFKRLRVVQ